MNIYIRFKHIVAEEAWTVGPFEWVQLTHEYLRISPDGEFLATLEDGDWHIENDDYACDRRDWTDAVIYAEP